MSDVVIYSSRVCGYCVRAKMLLDRKGVQYREILVDIDPQARTDMENRSNRRSVPQIFIGDRHIGGFQELHALDRQNELDPLLAD